MNRTQARELWRRVANGDLEYSQFDPVDLHTWIKDVARQVLAADEDPVDGRRVNGITEAVGLKGHEDRYAALRQIIEYQILIGGFDYVDDLGQVVTTPPDQKVRRMVRSVHAAAKGSGVLRGNYADDDKAARDLIRSLLPKSL